MDHIIVTTPYDRTRFKKTMTGNPAGITVESVGTEAYTNGRSCEQQPRIIQKETVVFCLFRTIVTAFASFAWPLPCRSTPSVKLPGQ